MGKRLGLSTLLIFLVFFLPWLWGEPAEAEDPIPTETPPAADSPLESAPAAAKDSSTMLRIKLGDTVQEMDMATYLLGVVRAEMPAAFQEEALKAQAVAARTYTLYKIEHGGTANHPEADACDDIHCCKAYLSAEEAAAKWGTSAPAYEEKIRRAVEETDGLCALYDGKPILAVFHSSSAGMTQDSAHVWSSSLPYLQSVSSPEDEKTVPNYNTEVSFSGEELQKKLKKALPEAKLGASPSTWFTGIRQEDSGVVTSITVGGVEVSGNRLRTILGLRSPCFTVSFSGEDVVFSVRGYGHGVGMSQYGANVLASEGRDFREILSWYYTGTSVEPYTLSR